MEPTTPATPGGEPASPAREVEELRQYLEIQEKINRGLRTFIAEMTIVFRFIETVSTFHSQERILNLLMDVMHELCGYDAAALFLAGSWAPKIAFHAEELEQYRQKLELDDRIYDWVERQGHAVVVPDSFRRQDQSGNDKWSYMIAPLSTSTERLGRIEMLFRRSQGAFTQQTFSIINVLLKHAGVILANERVYTKERATAKKYIELDMLKQDVVNTTTHEIKTPLTIIQAAAMLLQRNPRLPKEERAELLDKVIYQCARINDIVTELFETAQVEDSAPRLNPEPVSLSELTQTVLREIHYQPALIAFRLELPEQLPLVHADRPSLHKVVRNLIENAVKYSPKGGDIVVSADADSDTVRWRIEDHGLGISEADLPRIFTKFFRAGDVNTRTIRGMGFGLYLVKKNVELNQGTIQVQSTMGQGSTFTLEFPRWQPKE
ncbi:MAG: ATP-binding protein [candidate division FCPU426 bacterium]